MCAALFEGFIVVDNSYLALMDKLYKDVRNFYFINSHKLGNFDILRDFSVTTVGDLKIYYNVTKNIYGDDFIVFVDGSEDAASALHLYPSLTMTVDEGVAVFQWLERSDDCCIERLDLLKNLKGFIVGAVFVAKGLGYTKFAINDNSCVGKYSVSKCKYSYSLGAMYFVCYGQTLYESILGAGMQYMREERMNLYRNKAQTVAWSVVCKHLNNLYGLLDVDLTGIDIEAPGSCREVLLRVAALDNDKKNAFFTKYLTSVMFAAELPLFHNSLWTLSL